MTTPTTAENEIAAIREGGDFPKDMDWDAEYRILNTQYENQQTPIKADWTYALDHPYNGLENVITENGETIFDDTKNGILVAYRFYPTCIDGQTVVNGYMYPAVKTDNGEYHTIDDELIASSNIYVTMTNPRSKDLVQAFTENNQPQLPSIPEDEPEALTQDNRMPHDLTWNVQHDVMIDEEESQPQYPQPDWREMVSYKNGQPKQTNPDNDEATICMDFFGTPHIVQFQYRINDRGFVVATGTVHPATNPLDPDEPDTNITFAKAEITIRVEEPQTAAAMRQYVRQHLT